MGSPVPQPDSALRCNSATRESAEAVRDRSRRLGRVAPLLASAVTIGVLVLLLPVLRTPDSPATGPAHSRRPGDGLPPRTPNPWFFTERAYPLGAIPLDRWRAARAEALAARSSPRGPAASWTPRGPTNIGGRVTAIAVDQTDANVVFGGAAEGGVLRTLNGGQSWTPVFDDQPTLAIGAVAIDPSNNQVIYAGTGEVNPGGGSVAYGGAGLFRSTDRGDSWSYIGLPESGAIGRIRIDPTDSNRIFVAAMGQLWEDNPERGVYRSTDGGASWQRVLHVNDSTGCVDLIQRPDDPDVLLAAMWQRTRRPEVYNYGGPGCAVYSTDDGGNSWSQVGGGLPTPSSNGGRIGLSLCASQPNVMHAIYADRIGYFDGLYRSTNGGSSWTRTNDGALSSVYASYGWWFGNVRTHPTDPSRIFVLGYDFYRSTNGGSSWSDVGSSMHVDHHGLGFGPGSSPVMYEGNDGGIYRSTNGGSGWTKLADQPITQIYRVALDPSNPNALYGGAQDNGTSRTLVGSPQNWSWIYGGDGMQPLVHPNDSNRIWAQYQYGSLNYSSNGGSSWYYATGGIGGSDRLNWNCPLIQDPTNVNRRYFGTNRVYRSVDSTSWTSVSPDLTGGPHSGNPGQVNGTLTTLAVSPLDGQVIWSGSDDGHVRVTTNGGGVWSDVSTTLPDRWVTSVRTDPNDRETAYVTLSGYRWAEPLPRVFRTTDLGASWTSIGGNLPDAPVNDLVADPLHAARCFVATDVGVFETVDGGVTWAPLGVGLPNVVVTSMVLSAGRELYAGTYGRSFFSIAIGDPGPGSGYCFGDPGSGTPCPCDNDNDGSVPGSGCDNGVFPSGAQLTGSGEASLLADSLVLSTTGLEPGNSGLYFQADNDLSPGSVWGDGLRCAGGNLKRLQVRFADGSGASSTTIAIAAKAGNVVAGSIKRYQCWYRTTSNPPCGAGSGEFNATNGYAVAWGP